MKDYIFGERNGIYIIDLQKTQKLFRDALGFVQDFVTEKPNSKILFVGTKRQAQDAIIEEAQRCNQYFVNNRWLGGLMTNYKTVQKSIKRLKEIEEMKEDGRAEMLTKKERLQLDRELEKLMKNLSGIKDMNGLPDLLFVIDVRKEDIAIKEANRLNIPVVAVVDTNCSPEGVDYIIPGNDDALRAIRLFTSRVADAILEAQNIANEGMAEEMAQAAEAAEAVAEPTADAPKKKPAETKEIEVKTDAEKAPEPKAEAKPTEAKSKDAAPAKEKAPEKPEPKVEVKPTEAKSKDAAPAKEKAPEKPEPKVEAKPAEAKSEDAAPAEKKVPEKPEPKAEEKPESKVEEKPAATEAAKPVEKTEPVAKTEEKKKEVAPEADEKTEASAS